jgi:hypothetical protein
MDQQVEKNRNPLDAMDFSKEMSQELQARLIAEFEDQASHWRVDKSWSFDLESKELRQKLHADRMESFFSRTEMKLRERVFQAMNDVFGEHHYLLWENASARLEKVITFTKGDSVRFFPMADEEIGGFSNLWRPVQSNGFWKVLNKR